VIHRGSQRGTERKRIDFSAYLCELTYPQTEDGFVMRKGLVMGGNRDSGRAVCEQLVTQGYQVMAAQVVPESAKGLSGPRRCRTRGRRVAFFGMGR
jgi:hypothetical protein